MLSVQTNMGANTALKTINTNSVNMNKSLERLSSGFRINNAADDAAGFAVSSKLDAQSQRLKAASLNASQAQAMVKMADAGVNEIQNMTSRIQTLAIQASSANNAGELGKLDAERVKLESAINKIASSTNFNGVNLLNGVDSSKSNAAVASTAAVGSNIANTGFTATTSSTSGIYENASFAITTTAGVAATSGTLTSGLAAATANLTSVALNAGSATDASANGPIFLDNVAGVVKAYAGADNTAAFLGSVDLTGAAGTYTLNAANGVKLDFVTSAAVTVTSSNASSLAGASAATSGTVTSVKSTADLKDSSGTVIAAAGTELLAATQNRGTVAANLTLTLKSLAGGTPATITVADAAAGGAQKAGVSNVTSSGATAGTSVLYTAALAFQVGADNNANNQVSLDLTQSYTTASLGLGTGNLLSQASAQTYITTAKGAMNKLITQRADLGATQNQVAFVQANLATSIEQTTASVSAIRDADMAAEMADFTKNKILTQASTSMLAQANQAAQNVLSLFR